MLIHRLTIDGITQKNIIFNMKLKQLQKLIVVLMAVTTLQIFTKETPRHLGYLKVHSLQNLSSKLIKASEKIFNKTPCNPINEMVSDIKKLEEKISSF